MGRDLPRPGSMTRCGTRCREVGVAHDNLKEHGGPVETVVGADRIGNARLSEARLGPNLSGADRKSLIDVRVSAVRGWPH